MKTGLLRPSPSERLDAALAAYRAASWMTVRHTANAAEMVSPWGPERVLLEVLPAWRARQSRSWAAVAEPESLELEPQPPPPPGTTGQRDEVDRESPSAEERLGLILLMVLGLGAVLLVAPALLQFIIAVAQGLFGIHLDQVGVLLGIRVVLLLLIIMLRLVHALRDDWRTARTVRERSPREDCTMFNRSRPVCALAVAPLLLTLLSGCSSSHMEAAPLNVAAINGITAYRARMVEKVHGDDSSLTLNVVQEVVAPDRVQTTISSHVNGQNVSAESIGVGERVWVNTGAGWREQSIDASIRQAASHASIAICTAFKDLPARRESFHGQRAVHYTTHGASTAALDAGFDQLAGVLNALGAGTAGARFDVLSADLWTTADGAQPLRLKLKAAITLNGRDGTLDAQQDFSDMNGSDIDIEPPAMQ